MIAGYLAEARGRHAAAARAAGAHVVDLAVAGRAIRLRFAGPALVGHVVPALAHLIAPMPAGDPDLTIELFDTVSTGVPMLGPAWSIGELPASGEIPGSTRRLRAVFRLSTGMLILLDLDARVGLVWLRDAAQFDCYEAASPLRHLLFAYFEETGLCLVHAAAVGGVLLGGRGGSGKSTTALLGLAAGIDYAGDDQVLVDPAGPTAHCLYGTAKVLPATLVRFPSLAPIFAAAAPAAPGEKLVAFVGRRVARTMPVRAIVLPFVTAAARSTLSPMPRAAALRGLAASTVLQQPGAGSTTLGAVARMTATVPSFRLALGADVDEISRIIDGVAR